MHSLLHSDTNKNKKTTAFLLWLYMAFTGLTCHYYQFDDPCLTQLLCTKKFDDINGRIIFSQFSTLVYYKLNSIRFQSGFYYRQIIARCVLSCLNHIQHLKTLPFQGGKFSRNSKILIGNVV